MSKGLSGTCCRGLGRYSTNRLQLRQISMVSSPGEQQRFGKWNRMCFLFEWLKRNFDTITALSLWWSAKKNKKNERASQPTHEKSSYSTQISHFLPFFFSLAHLSVLLQQ
jgi:hypothetical protein